MVVVPATQVHLGVLGPGSVLPEPGCIGRNVHLFLPQGIERLAGRDFCGDDFKSSLERGFKLLERADLWGPGDERLLDGGRPNPGFFPKEDEEGPDLIDFVGAAVGRMEVALSHGVYFKRR